MGWENLEQYNYELFQDQISDCQSNCYSLLVLVWKMVN